MIIGTHEALRRLAREWERDAGQATKYDPADPKALVLAACAERLRGVLERHAQDWVSIGAVQAWSGWSRQTIRRRCRDELEPRGEARKGQSGEWEVDMRAALAWPQRSTTEAITDGTADLSELARIVARAE